MNWTIGLATLSERKDALELVLRQESDSDTDSADQANDLLESCENHEICLDGLLVARQNSKLLGATLVIHQSDGTAHVWAPAVSPHISQDTAISQEVLTRLAMRSVDWLKTSGAKLAQCITGVDRQSSHRILESAGFEPLTELVSMQHPLEDIPHAPLPDDCDFTTFTEEIADRFEEVMRQTYASSEDCQGLQGRRTAAECLAAHRLAGSFNPELWQLFHVLDEDMGIVLCANHVDQQIWELLYLGVTPKFRKQGFGVALVSDALWTARVAGAEGVLVAVDASNVAARSLYEMCGFQERFRRQIHIWTRV